MNYQEYRNFKEGLDLAGYKRLDCMNPFKAMSFTDPVHNSVSESEADNFLYSLTGRDVSFCSGVRDALKTLFRVNNEKQIYIPNEVYPVYFDLVEVGSDFCSYSIFDKSALQDVEDSLILYTFNHFGDLELNLNLGRELLSKGNILLIDAVYDYAFSVKEFYSLLSSEKCFILSSFSKTQLCRSFGYVIHDSHVEFNKPEEYFSFNEEVSAKQLRIFAKRWKQLESQLEFKLSDSRHPYFKLLDKSFEELLEKKILGIPMSVFSRYNCCDDKTVVSCLYEIDRYV
ncbi:MAG: hypothetical protein NE327_10395 [Lentisphaeraceae bacterium]|nr:hypothetical protein [Lentisphaeraceae bacterium]